MSCYIACAAYNGSEWVPVTAVHEGERPGSLSSQEPDGRQIVLFGWLDGIPSVWQSVRGIDQEIGDFRIVASAAVDRLADLRDGPYERLVKLSQAFIVRWELREI